MKTSRLTSNDRAVLLGSRLFANLPAPAAEAVLEGATISRHEAQDVLFHQGDAIEHVFFVVSGLVRLYGTGKGGREADIAVFPRVALFGEKAVFLDQRATAHAQAVHPSIIAKLDGPRLCRLVREEADVAWALLELLCRHGQMTEKRLAEDRLLTAPQRVANYILGQCPGDSPAFTFRLPFQKNVLAGKLGLAPEALSRAFSTLRQSGVIVKGRLIEIRDREALERF
ncbi:cyclic nucleotide-binding domain-containing protein [Sinorhizobium medicae]|nr:cyclic nucleotide-binding domain-containing protein [Sinorhizobium medicae]MDX1180384.1 cyclic nucleotide-binding domain-containing protein [Sinorhizobium medicae]